MRLIALRTDHKQLMVVDTDEVIYGEKYKGLEWRRPGHNILTGKSAPGWWEAVAIPIRHVEGHFDSIWHTSLLDILITTGATRERLSRLLHLTEEYDQYMD